jgi:DNA-binding MarR family transcriptional regulator
VGYAARFLERSIRRVLSDALKQFDLTLAQYTVLSLLGIREGLSNAQLARRSYVSPQAMSELVRHLEQRGLVVRAPIPEHARIHPARLTPDGHAVLAECDDVIDRIEQAMIEEAGIDDPDGLADAMMSCARTLAALEPARHGTGEGPAAG